MPSVAARMRSSARAPRRACSSRPRTTTARGPARRTPCPARARGRRPRAVARRARRRSPQPSSAHRGLDVRKQIERAGRPARTRKPGRALTPAKNELVPPLELRAHLAHAASGRPIERCARGRLRDRAGVGRALALQARHRLDHGQRAPRRSRSASRSSRSLSTCR